MILLLQFVLRLTFGLATGMALTSPKRVTSGYFRNHLYVVLGLTMLAALVSHTEAAAAFWPVVLAAVASYVGTVCWLYEQPRAGIACLMLVAGLALLATWLSLPGLSLPGLSLPGLCFRGLAAVSSGLLLGFTMAAMLLGHWYLNSPTMELAPLRRLILAMAVAVALQGVVAAVGLWGNIEMGHPATTGWVLFLLIRWLFGLMGVSLLSWMAWQTLKVPNTQSATGILYVAVIGTFVGETMALLLSSEAYFPL